MTTPQFGTPGYDPADLAAAARQMTQQPPPALPPEADLAADLAAKQAGAPSGITSVDVDKLLAGIDALQKRVQALEAEKATGAAVPVVGAAEALRDLIAAAAAHDRQGRDHSEALALADDAVDAARNSADSGDAGPLTEITGKVSRALHRLHPGPGDHHYYQQALTFADSHLPDAAAQLVKRASTQPAVPAGRGAVVQGSVTG